ncbi:endonuclease/exonuclease/phosphatase family protein [Micromonospora sp. NPDC047738]|uniref:endonuclease/exonuclease/phosphatase family protein n=1 Tax=Micromonospora sp. NPDC047738 TaxID=3155741 RepID=UPI0033E96CAC
MPGPGVPLRVVSYNVHSQRDDTAALAEVVREAAPDVVIVQEGPRRFRWRQKCASLADSFGLVVAAGGLPSLGNLLLTSLRVRVVATRCQRYPLTPGRHLRGAAYAECLVAGSRFLLAGSHLSTDPAERPAQAAAFKRELAATTLPVVAGADLNEEPDGPAWRTVAQGLTDTALAADRADRHTFPCANPQRRIDALFVDPRITVVDYDVVDTPRTRRASDHFPVLVDLLLPAG